MQQGKQQQGEQQMQGLSQSASQAKLKTKLENPMRQVLIEKLVLNIGTGKEQSNLTKAMKLLKLLTGFEPVKTLAKKRIPAWGLRPGLPVGCKKTLRGEKALEILKLMLKAKDNKLSQNCFDDYGNVNFGIEEYIAIPGVKYDPEIGIIGLQVSVTLKRKGFRVKHRRLRRTHIGKKHLISKQEAIDFFKTLGVVVE